MSFKAKDLSYEANEPSFLRAIRANISGGNTDPDRHAQGSARPRRAKTSAQEDDDSPTYVDEATGETVSGDAYRRLLRDEEGVGEAGAEAEGGAREERDRGDGKAGAEGTGEDVERRAEAQTEVGKKQEVNDAVGPAKMKKRKAVKAVGGVHEDEGAADPGGNDKEARPAKKKMKKKLAPAAGGVKLSFGGDDEEG